jgi:hypothetical protein
MSDVNTPLPFEGDPVVEPQSGGGDAIDIGQDTEIDAGGDAGADAGRIPTSGNDEPTSVGLAHQDSAAAEANGQP